MGNQKDILQEYPKVTRVEVIDNNGRAYTCHINGCRVAIQDDGRTLKVFLRFDGDSQ